VNILYLCHRIPFPPDKGDKIRSYHQIESLGARHRVHVATFVDSAEDERHVPELRERCASLIVDRRTTTTNLTRAAAALWTGDPFSVACFRSSRIARGVERALREERIDLALVFSSGMAQYVEGATGIARVIDFVDVDSEKWRVYAERDRGPLRLLYAREAKLLLAHDARIAHAFDGSLFVSETEAALFRERSGAKNVSAIPMGVDLDYFRPAPEPALAPVLVFVGMMSYMPNVDAMRFFVGDVLPLLRREIPGVSLHIVGREPVPAVRALADPPHVVVTGAVPDVRPYLREAAVALAPFRISRGMQSKVLEAMASGLPVVGTRLAFQGIPAGTDDGVEAAETADALAASVARLLRDPAERRDRGVRARRYVERHHRWADHGEALDAFLEGVLARSRGSSHAPSLSPAGARSVGGPPV
jgi:sugar transferase (PEP-CTERM/EpsH1 system associated)